MDIYIRLIKQISRSLQVAINGIWLIVKNEPNFRFELIVMGGVIIAGLILKVTYFEWLILFIIFALVLVSEAVNSVVEALCDTVASEYRLNIKYAKDVAAGMVLLMATFATIVGMTIFFPRLYTAIKIVLMLIIRKSN